MSNANRINDEGQMTNDERNPKLEARNPTQSRIPIGRGLTGTGRPRLMFGFSHSDFLRHLAFVIRHSFVGSRI